MGLSNRITRSTDKFSNLNRLDLRNKFLVLSFLFKSVFKIKPSDDEHQSFHYYHYLVKNDGILVSETSQHYIADFNTSVTNRIKLRKKPSSDIHVFQQIYGSLEYLPVVKSFKENFPDYKESKLNIIDAGSNIGLTSLYFTDHFDAPNIVCIEPEPENFKILEYNLSAKENIRKINGGIWNSDIGIKVVSDFRDKSDWSFRVIESHDADAIKAYSIGSLAEDNGFKQIDILKIDVEGSEKQILTSEIKPDFLNITKCLAVEIHDEFNCRADIYKVLDSYRFEYFNVGELTIGINTRLKHNPT